jgi:asparagine synthase (glutamine-hydrolysing)
MTAIAGLIPFDGRLVDLVALEKMRKALTPYGRDAQHLWHDESAGLVRTLCRITPEDTFDRQPLKSENGRFILVADGRVDNREELADVLGIPPSQACRMADSAFFLAAFERWGQGCLKRLLGDFAFAVWEQKSKRLLLARDPLGHRPLYWYKNRRFFAFATMPKGLFAVPEVPRSLCEECLADYLALLPMKGPQSLYKDIFRIEPGYLMVLEDSLVHSQRYHRFDPEHRIILKNDDEYVEGARELLDRAVGCRLRSAGGVASYLSSGLDSSTVTATAARLLEEQGKRLLAFTSVPREGFDGPVPKGRHADEGPAAAALAARFPNIEHIIFRSGKRTPLDGLLEKVEIFDRPPLNPCNHVWLDGIEAETAQRGAKVLLTGQRGNMSISYTGQHHLPWLLHRGRVIKWLTEAYMLVRNNEMRLKGVLRQSVSPFVPMPIWRAFKARKSRRSVHDYSAIHPDLALRTNLHLRLRQAGRNSNSRPSVDGWRMRTEGIFRMDPGDFFEASVGSNGLEVRDPTIDLRLFEFCLAIPEDQYLKNGRPRSLLHRMMKNVLPPEILSLKTRGLQAADWYEGAFAARDAIRKWLDRLDVSAEAPRLIDLKRMRELFKNWPEGGWEQDSVIRTYRYLLLRGMSVGLFIHYAEGG